MNNVTSPGMQQLIIAASALPSVCVILTGIVLALRHMSICQRPAMLTFVAMLLLLSATIGQPMTLGWVLPMARLDLNKFPLAYAAINLTFTTVRAVSYVILLRAVFVDRSRPDQPLAPGSYPPPPQTRVL